jgi:hypothetical protein
MIPVFKVNYTISEDDGTITFSDSFYSHHLDECRLDITNLMNDYDVTVDNIFVDGDAIYGVGNQYDVTVTVEQLNILGDEALTYLITDEGTPNP